MAPRIIKTTKKYVASSKSYLGIISVANLCLYIWSLWRRLQQPVRESGKKKIVSVFWRELWISLAVRKTMTFIFIAHKCISVF